MSRINKGHCLHCHKYYEGRGEYFCSRECKTAYANDKPKVSVSRYNSVSGDLYENVSSNKEELASRLCLISQNEQLKKQIEKLKNIEQIIIDNSRADIAKMNIKPIDIPPRNKSKTQLIFDALRSDAQVGELTVASGVQGISHYDIPTYIKRLNNWVDRVITFKEQDRNSLGLNDLAIYHLGDQIEGESIYPGQPFQIDVHLTEQLFISVEQECNALLSLSKYFNSIEVFCISGNHGRVGKKGDHSVKANFDYIFYRVLQLMLANQPNIKMYISESPAMIVRQGDYNFFLHHGDNTVSWAGIPYYGVERMFSRLSSLYGMIINYGLLGHHHQAANLCDRIIMNGCMPGGSELSINKMSVSSQPSQKIFYFDKHHGINRETNLILDKPDKLVVDKNNIYTSYV